jgi:hypothetical protein
VSRASRLELSACLILTALGLTACGSSSSTAPSTSLTTPSVSSNWVKDSINDLNVFLPDADSVYWFDGYGTTNGARTVISGQNPTARYWSFTAYPFPPDAPKQHVHDDEVQQADGHYTVTIATSCSGVRGTCLAMGSVVGGGVVVFRLYVPADLSSAGTGGAPLPRISYESASGSMLTLAQASGSQSVPKVMDGYRAQNGALPAVLTKSYPPPAPVPNPVVTPPPAMAVNHGGEGPYSNPDNFYQHVRYTTTRGDLVVSAEAPTYQSDSFPKANDLARPAAQNPQVRYWSLCTVLKGRHTGDCLRDEQVHIPSGSVTFTVIVAPTCPVSGYANCIDAGPEPLQNSLSYRNLLPSQSFAPRAFTGPFRLTATYVARPG